MPSGSSNLDGNVEDYMVDNQPDFVDYGFELVPGSTLGPRKKRPGKVRQSYQ